MLGVAISDLTPYGVLLVFVLMVGFGLLIPRRTHNERINDYKEQIALLRKILAERDDQLLMSLGVGRPAVRVLEEIKEVAASK